MGISQESLARLIGVDPGTLSRLEAGKSTPTKAVLKRVDQFFASLRHE